MQTFSHTFIIIASVLSLLICGNVKCMAVSESLLTPPADSLVAFPGAEGFGRHATGGRGGQVFHVTTLSDGDQFGTLRYALSQKCARIIVFDVAGTIFLDKPLYIRYGNLTIAGQSAPGQGICIARYPLNIAADNVVMRYLRLRVGNEGEGEPDGLSICDHRNIIVDHCSISWSVDEACSVYGNENATVQWCLISESLRMAGHSKGCHGYGGIVGGAHMSFHHNLMAHHGSRVPRLGPRPGTQAREWVDMRCNVFYNWAGNGCYGGEGMKVNIVNNYYKPGPATPQNNIVRYRIFAPGVRTTGYCHTKDGRPNSWAEMEHVWGKYYIAGNVMENNPDVTADNWTRGVYAQIRPEQNDGLFDEAVCDSICLREPLYAGVVTTHSAADAYRLVLAYAGCSKERDALDWRIVAETRSGTATRTGSVSDDAALRPGLIDVPADAVPEHQSPWPALHATAADIPVDTDGDGIPDEWEKVHGLNPFDGTDGTNTTLSTEGYTNVEVYLNELVADITRQQNQLGNEE